jgi:uncharacterized protein YhhL (DUF1145 family)
MRVFEYWLVWLINLVYNYGEAVGDALAIATVKVSP